MIGGAGGSQGGAIAGGGSVAFHTLLAVPPAQFQTIELSGDLGVFTPSSWIQFDKGLAEGRAELAAQHKSLAEVAAENRLAERPRAKFMISQDAEGKAILIRR